FDGVWTDVLGGVSGLLTIIGGNAMVVRQLQERRRSKRFVQDLRNDLLEAVAWQFEREFPAGSTENPLTRKSADVLPRSNVILTLDDKTVDALTMATVTEVAVGGTGAIDAPLSTFEPASGTEDFDFRQRHLTSTEKDELGRLLRRELKTFLIRTAVLLWAGTALAG